MAQSWHSCRRRKNSSTRNYKKNKELFGGQGGN
jgi:hypothetical protein